MKKNGNHHIILPSSKWVLRDLGSLPSLKGNNLVKLRKGEGNIVGLVTTTPFSKNLDQRGGKKWGITKANIWDSLLWLGTVLVLIGWPTSEELPAIQCVCITIAEETVSLWATLIVLGSTLIEWGHHMMKLLNQTQISKFINTTLWISSSIKPPHKIKSLDTTQFEY